MFYLTPTENNAKAKEMYEKNIFSVTRQLMYSNDSTRLALDMCIFINGLPVITFELKNQLTKQNVDDAVQQYKDDRDPRELLFQFKRCMVHFAVDDARIKFCTKLDGKKSWFLPFDKGYNDGAGNPPNPDGLMTDYLWKKILTKDNEDRINAMMEGRKLLPNASYFAFTATPKNKTLETFGTLVVDENGNPVLNEDGEVQHRPFHSYTMKQAIQEGFILDVLKYYTPISSYYKLMKTVQDDPMFDKKRAQKKLRAFVESDSYTISQKAEMMVEHFHEQVISKGKVGGQARAMVVTSSIGRPFDDDWGLMDPTGKSDKDFIEVIKEIEDKIIQLNNSL